MVVENGWSCRRQPAPTAVGSRPVLRKCQPPTTLGSRRGSWVPHQLNANIRRVSAGMARRSRSSAVIHVTPEL